MLVKTQVLEGKTAFSACHAEASEQRLVHPSAVSMQQKTFNHGWTQMNTDRKRLSARQTSRTNQ
jgi:hypothetical protein